MLTFAVWVRVPRRVQLFFLPLGPLNVQCGQTLSAGLWEVGSISQIPSPISSSNLREQVQLADFKACVISQQ